MNRRKRKKIPTILIICEGESDKEFLQFLKDVWSNRYSGGVITLKTFHGGGIGHTIKKTQRNQIESSRVYLFFDKFTIDKERSVRIPRTMHLIKSEPCLEALVCHILGARETFEGKNEKDCKRHFKSTYGGGMVTREWLKQNITKEMLEKAIEQIPCLKEIQKIMRGEWE